jgi:hypothetical protein
MKLNARQLILTTRPSILGIGVIPCDDYSVLGVYMLGQLGGGAR